MPRRRVIAKREIPADPLYQSPLVTKFISCVMSDGKRSTAERIFYKSFDIIKEKTSDDPLKIFKKAIDNVKPSLEVKSRRVGGSNYQVPVEVNPNRRLSLSIRWIVGYATARGDGKTMQEKLANELLDAQRPDVVFYLAGADPYQGDRLGRLKLTVAGLRARDRFVFDTCGARDLPVVITMSGG